ncbi:hypothetical protein E0K89_016195 [Aquicoccus sp. SCR17]|nr:hypothetical protein [Carideicomes alvinocaridis]
MRARPLPLLFGALALAGLAKTGAAILDRPDEAAPLTGSAFLSAASAASGLPDATPAPTPAEPALCETPEAMLEAIREERALLDEQKARMEQRRSEIDLAGEKLAIDRGTLAELRDALQAMFDRVEQAHTADVDRLVALYSAMKPKEAAAIMDDLDIEVSVMVLATMPERDAAPILARLNPVRARAISRIIMERSKLPGDQRLDGLKL